MAITKIQQANGSRTCAGTTYVITLGSAPTNGNSIILVSTNLTAGKSISSISQTGATWVLAKKHSDAASGLGLGNAEIWYANNVIGASTSITVTMSATGVVSFGTAVEYSGLVTSSVLDLTSGNDGTTNPFSSGNISNTAQANELVVTGFFVEGSSIVAGDFSPGTGFTNINESTENSAYVEAFDHQILSSISAPDDAASYSGTTTTWSEVLATFKGAVVATSNYSLFFAGD